MAALVLHLGNQNRFALEARGAADPVALGQHADNFTVGVLADLAHQSFAVSVGHPIFGLDLAVGINDGIKLDLGGVQHLLLGGSGHRGHGFGGCGPIGHVERLGVHGGWAPIEEGAD